METDDPRLLQQWALHWREVGTITGVPAVPSAQTREVVDPLLD